MDSYLIVLLSCAAVIYQAASVPRWSWGKFADLESLPSSNKQLKDCTQGQCFQGWKCPENETALEEPTTCSKRSGGHWICCIRLTREIAIEYTEKPIVTTPLIIKNLIDKANVSNSINKSTTPDWVSVGVHVGKSKEDHSQENANIVNWGKSHVYSPKHSNWENNRDDTYINNRYKPYVWSKGSTSNPLNKITDDKWLDPVSAELRNRYPSDTEYDTVAENSWDYNINHRYTKKTTKNRAVSTTPSYKWTSTKSAGNRDRPSSKPINKWSTRTTASSWARATGEMHSKIVNSRSTTNTPFHHSWTKSTKSVYDWDPSYGSTTSKPSRKTTTSPSRRSTDSFEKRNRTKSTMKPTKESWNWDLSSNNEEKSSKARPITPTTRKSMTPKISTRSSSTTINYRLTTPRSSSIRSTVNTRKPSVENIERSGSSSRMPPVVTRSTTKKYSSTTPLPDVNSHRCGIRVTSREVPRRGKRQLDSEVVSYTGILKADRNRLPFQRIVGGKEAEPFSWPWVAALYRVSESGGNRFLSAGSLINRNFVLTAAHVFTPDDLRSASFVVMLGTHTAREAVAEYTVMYVLRHPNYQQRFYYNDIALLRLERSVDFNEYVMPVCLPSPSLPLVKEEDLVGKQVTVMGWGDESYGGKTSRVLQEASFPIVPRKSCNASYFQVASNRFPRGITSNMLCAGDPNGGKDACQGDSGGPLTTVENGRHTQVGIVSFGYKCGDKEYPGVYTKVAPYLNWIAENSHCDDHSDYNYYYSR